nr:uncharacterized protein [Tanacetum cinerariifolium]
MDTLDGHLLKLYYHKDLLALHFEMLLEVVLISCPKEDPEEDPSEEHEPEDNDDDPEEDRNEEHESKGSDETEPFKEDKIAVTPPPPRHRGARISVRPQTPMAASTQALIDAFAFGSSPFPPAYDQAQLGHRVAMIHRKDDILEEDMPPRRRFALTGSPPGCDVAERQGLIRSPGHDTRTIARSADRAEDASYVRMQERENFYTQLLDAQTDRKDIRLEIDVVRGQRTAYETELQETLKKKFMEKYCPKGEIKKLEIELWNLRVKGNDAAAYTQRFQELALMCTKFLPDETEKEPVAFMGGMFAGLLRLNLNEDPLKEWVTRTVEASGFTDEELDPQNSTLEVPQQIDNE